MTAFLAGDRSWQPTPHAGIRRALLREPIEGGRVSLVRLDKGARFPEHVHEAEEDVLVLEGQVAIAGNRLSAGDYLFTQAGQSHDVVALTDALIYVASRKPTPLKAVAQPA